MPTLGGCLPAIGTASRWPRYSWPLPCWWGCTSGTTSALAAEVIDAVPDVDSNATGVRLAGILWLGAAAVVLWYALGSLGASIWSKALLIGFLVVAPRVLHESSIINPDTTALLGGALVLAATLRWEAGRAPGWLVPLAAMVALWLKFTNAFAIGAAVLYLGARAWQQREVLTSQQLRRWLAVAGSTVILTLASVITWTAVQEARGLIPPEQLPTNVIYHVDSFQWNNLGGELFSALTPLQDQFVPDALPRDLLEPLGDLLNLLLLAGLGAVAVVSTKRSQFRALAAAAVAAMVATGVVTMVTSYLSVSVYFDTNPRYGLSLLPIAVASLVPVLNNRFIRWVLTAVVLATAGAVFAGVVS